MEAPRTVPPHCRDTQFVFHRGLYSSCRRYSPHPVGTAVCASPGGEASPVLQVPLRVAVPCPTAETRTRGKRCTAQRTKAEDEETACSRLIDGFLGKQNTRCQLLK